MADLTKLKKRRNTLGAPPSPDEASQNLKAPEVAPVITEPTQVMHHAAVPSTPAAAQPDEVPLTDHEQGRRDGRTLRKTGRTLQFATRVSWEFDDKLRRIAQRDKLLLVQVLERSLDAYEKVSK
jgi:hypothetical protein